MNARPTLLFAMRLAGHLGMTLGELHRRMDCKEFALWLAMHTYYEPIGGAWEQTGVIASAALAPYCRRGTAPAPEDFIPIAKSKPQHKTQIAETLRQMAADIGSR